MTEAGLRAFVDAKLASESAILATEHREVENAIIDYLIQENETLQTQVDNIIANPPTVNPFIRKGTRVIGNVSTDQVITVNFDDIGTTNYMVVGSLVGNSGDFNQDNDVFYIILNKTSNSFGLATREVSANTQVLSFDYAIILF